MSLLTRLFRKSDPKQRMAPLYAAVVARGRDPDWYVAGRVPDTLDGRFDMIAAVLSIVLLRLETAGLRQENVWLTELFVDDMDGQLRQIGVGDVVVGKHIGRMISALGGRLTAYREELAPEGNLEDALRRNLYRGAPVDSPAVDHVAKRLRAFARAVDAQSIEALATGTLPE